MNHSLPEDLPTRIHRLLDGEMDAQELALLEIELQSNPEARKLYLQYTNLHSALENHFASESEINHGRIIPIDRYLARQRIRNAKFSGIAAAAILMISGLILWSQIVKTPNTIASFQSSPDSQFKISHSKNANSAADQSMRPGSRLQLSTGTIEVTFSSGVRCLFDAPCEITFHNEKRISVIQGVGWFQVPNGIDGFTVQTRSLKVVDLGTAFGIIAKQNGLDEVHVIQGSVEVTPKKSSNTEWEEILKAGSARRFDESGKITTTAFDASHFPKQLIKPLKIRNAGFEESVLSATELSEVGYGPVYGWAVIGAGVGHNNLSQPFLRQPAHEGNHAAFIQSKGLLSQTVSGFDSSKLYTVTYFVSERGLPGASTSTSVSLDLGVSFYAPLHPITKTDAFRRIVSGPLKVFSPTANIQISASPLTGDASLLLDSVSITRAVPAIPDGGFEFPVLTSRAFKQGNGLGHGDLSLSAWAFVDGGGIATNGSAFIQPTAPEGSQVAILQNGKASLQTAVSGFEPGVTYSISLEAAGRKGEVLPFKVLLDDETLLFDDKETIYTQESKFSTYTSDHFTAKKETYILHVQAAGTGTSYIDDLRFNFVAEAE